MMLIPDAFVKCTRLQGWRIPADVILTNVGTRVWNVKTRLVRNKIYFEEGWKVFQEENFVGKEDYLVFKYDGANIFKVVILEQSSRCEKTEVEEEDEVIDITDDEEHEEAEDDDNDDDEYRDMEEESEEHSAEYTKSQTHPLRASNRENASSSSPIVEGPHLEDYEIHKCIFSREIHILKQSSSNADPTNWILKEMNYETIMACHNGHSSIPK
ncbi:B3 domain-containing protein [Glycine soja]